MKQPLEQAVELKEVPVQQTIKEIHYNYITKKLKSVLLTPGWLPFGCLFNSMNCHKCVSHRHQALL